MTAVLSEQLAGILRNRSNAETLRVRESTSSSKIHSPSGEPWWRISGRYYLKRILPNNPEIWNSYSPRHKTEGDRERNDDINARPLYANFVNAETLLLVHTNATDPPGFGTGSLVLYKDAASRILAYNISCHMGELITSRKRYKNFRINSPRSRTNLGELNLARMPAVVIEVAFHDRPSDAAALLDPIFRTYALRGIEKGLRLWKRGIREDRECKYFNPTSWPDVTAVRGGASVPHNINFEGNPRFPVKLTYKTLACSSNSCDYSERELTTRTERPSPLLVITTCSGSSMRVTSYLRESYLTDADGIRTGKVTTTITCLPGGADVATAANRDIEPALTLGL